MGMLHAPQCVWAQTCFLIIKAAGLGTSLAKRNDHGAAAYFTVIVYLAGTFLGRRQSDLEALKAGRTDHRSCFHTFNLLPRGMIVNQLSEQKPFTTADGSTIRSILDATNAPVEKQSLAEASLPEGGETQRHYHKQSEEIYFILEGQGRMEIDGDIREVGPSDAILIPRNAWHQIKAVTDISFLCCCAPVYSHEDTYFESTDGV